MTAHVYQWDWQEQAPMAEIADEINRLAERQVPAFLTPVGETGGDCYAVVVSDIKLTREQADKLYETPDAVVKVEVAIEYPTGHQVDVIDIPLADLIGLEGTAREDAITEFAMDCFNNACSFGALETGTVDYPDEE